MSQKVKNKECAMGTATWIMILSIVGIVFFSIAIDFGDVDSQMISDLSRNLKLKGIARIFESNSSKCPSGSNSLFGLVFPGTKSFCLCENLSSDKHQIQQMHHKKCYSNSQFKCTKSNINNQVMKQFQGKVLCKQSTEFNYETYAKVEAPENCPKETRVCGRDRQSFLCLKHSFPCPINFLEISHDKNRVEDIPGGQFIALNNKKYLIFSNENTTGQIVVEFDWVFLEKCMDPSEILIKKANGLELLNSFDSMVSECSNVAGTTSDGRWETLDSYNFYDLISENFKIFKELEGSSLTSPEQLAKPIVLKSRSYIHFNKKCKPDQDLTIHENLENMSMLSENHKSSFLGLLIAGLVIICLLCLAAVSYCCCLLQTNSLGVLKNTCITLFILMTVTTILVAVTFGLLTQAASSREELASNKCVGSETAHLFQFSRKHRQFFWIGLCTLLILSGIGLCALVCHVLCCWFKKTVSETDSNSFPLDFLDESDRRSTGSSMKYPFEKEQDEFDSDPWSLYKNSVRGSDYNYWDVPDQQINEFNYSFHTK